MRKTIVVKGPALSRSGYGEQTRYAIRALRSREELFDLYIVNIPWGNTSHLMEDNEETQFIRDSVIKTQMHINAGRGFDMSLQVTIPNEFEKIAQHNVGYTAGIETTIVAPEWIQKANETVDKVIVVSEHSKKIFEQSKYEVQDKQGNVVPNWGLNVPIESIGYATREFKEEDLGLEFTTSKNFLTVAQWGPRKNLENTIGWFIQEFREDEDVGLVIKANTVNDSIIDHEATVKRLDLLRRHIGEHKCKIYLIHGELPPGGLTWLYNHPTMKALINIAHGEGYGLPLFEAAQNGLPLITITWSGQLDFICKPNKKGKKVPHVIKVDYDIAKVPPQAVWKGVIPEHAMWAYARENSYKAALRDCLNKEKHYKQRAKVLQKHILANFTPEVMYDKFVDLIYPAQLRADVEKEIDNLLADLL